MNRLITSRKVLLIQVVQSSLFGKNTHKGIFEVNVTRVTRKLFSNCTNDNSLLYVGSFLTTSPVNSSVGGFSLRVYKTKLLR